MEKRKNISNFALMTLVINLLFVLVLGLFIGIYFCRGNGDDDRRLKKTSGFSLQHFFAGNSSPATPFVRVNIKDVTVRYNNANPENNNVINDNMAGNVNIANDNIILSSLFVRGDGDKFADDGVLGNHGQPILLSRITGINDASSPMVALNDANNIEPIENILTALYQKNNISSFALKPPISAEATEKNLDNFPTVKVANIQDQEIIASKDENGNDNTVSTKNLLSGDILDIYSKRLALTGMNDRVEIGVYDKNLQKDFHDISSEKNESGKWHRQANLGGGISNSAIWGDVNSRPTTTALKNKDIILLEGWGGDIALGREMQAVIFEFCGKQIGHAFLGLASEDIALNIHANLTHAGWKVALPVYALPRCEKEKQILRAWAVGADGISIYPMAGFLSLSFADGDATESEIMRYNISLNDRVITPYFIKKGVTSAIDVPKGGIKIYQCPNHDCTVINELREGRLQLSVVDKRNGWSLIEFDTLSGWINQPLDENGS